MGNATLKYMMESMT